MCRTVGVHVCMYRASALCSTDLLPPSMHGIVWLVALLRHRAGRDSFAMLMRQFDIIEKFNGLS